MADLDLNFPHVIADDGPAACEILVTRLDVARETVNEAATLLSDGERQRARRFAFDRHRARFIVARAQLRRLLGARLGIRPESIEFVYGLQGKPALSQRLSAAGLHFNVSHSGGVAVYAFAKEREVGIDVEAIRALPDADAVAEHFFSPREYETYRSLAAADRLAGFFNCWTRKEAFIKAIGDGFSYPLHEFDVSLAPREPATIFRVGQSSGARCGWSLRHLEPWPGYVAAAVTRIVRNDALEQPSRVQLGSGIRFLRLSTDRTACTTLSW